MTVKKALNVIDFLIQGDTMVVDGMNRHIIEWTKPNEEPDIPTRTAIMLRDISLQNIKFLEIIKKELVPKCKHPKKMRDRAPNGQWYCMNCNLDL